MQQATDAAGEARAVVQACLQTKHLLGAGHLEKVYQRVLIEQLLAAGFDVQQEIVIPITFNERNVGSCRADVLASRNGQTIALELKAEKSPTNRAHLIQLNKYLIHFSAHNGANTGFVVNFVKTDSVTVEFMFISHPETQQAHVWHQQCEGRFRIIDKPNGISPAKTRASKSSPAKAAAGAGQSAVELQLIAAMESMTLEADARGPSSPFERVRAAALTVTRGVGPGHSTSVYLNCLRHQLGLLFPSHVSSAAALPVLYEGREIAEYSADLLLMPADDRQGCVIMVESTKTPEGIEVCHRLGWCLLQDLSHLRLSGVREVIIWHVNVDDSFFVRVQVYEHADKGPLITREVVGEDLRIWESDSIEATESKPDWLQQKETDRK